MISNTEIREDFRTHSYTRPTTISGPFKCTIKRMLDDDLSYYELYSGMISTDKSITIDEAGTATVIFDDGNAFMFPIRNFVIQIIDPEVKGK